MAQVELIMPKMGESVAEATIIKWLKNEGDRIAIDDVVLEIATDKVDSEIPSPFEGILMKKLFNEGDVIQVGKPIAILSSEVNASVSSAPVTPIEEKKEDISTSLDVTTATKQQPIVQQTVTSNGSLSTKGSNRFYSPLVKTIAKKEGISVAELKTISGSGSHGRVTKNDILNYLPNKGKVQTREVVIEKTPVSNGNGASVKSEPVQQNIQKPNVTMMNGDEIIEMDRMRKMIAEHMVMSKHVSPHVTSFVEADVTNLVRWRERVKKDFEKREKEKLTYTPIFVEAVVKAIKDYPMINVSLDGTKIIVRKNINIGMAAALPSGNLIVPVIKNADRMNLFGLCATVNDLAARARAGKLNPDDIAGGTYTISNVGSFGNLMGTPIINQPQVAILAVGSIVKKPAVIETPSGDTIGIRHMMFLSHSYDHRVVDGALGGMFVRKVADYLENWDVNREI
ncbi:MAG TPA: dihydrolipoamide acetyltransferase family protein [Bacteroidia bacterium]|jgi:2-oxoglutarate dehydrogenase E2 component (dihydrolipoamide succinyltransferase)|nr:dihydrolipoamide acetyltransferase family protein [Bacteroidia bacterium]